MGPARQVAAPIGTPGRRNRAADRRPTNAQIAWAAAPTASATTIAVAPGRHGRPEAPLRQVARGSGHPKLGRASASASAPDPADSEGAVASPAVQPASARGQSALRCLPISHSGTVRCSRSVLPFRKERMIFLAGERTNHWAHRRGRMYLRAKDYFRFELASSPPKRLINCIPLAVTKRQDTIPDRRAEARTARLSGYVEPSPGSVGCAACSSATSRSSHMRCSSERSRMFW